MEQPTLISGNRRLLVILASAGMLLSIPLIAMQITEEVNWKPFDFLVAGVLLFGSGLLCELVLRKVKSKGARMVLCGIVLAVLALIWAELAVGIFGSALAGS